MTALIDFISEEFWVDEVCARMIVWLLVTCNAMTLIVGMGGIS